MLRQEVRELINLGAFPESGSVDLATIEKQQMLLDGIVAPISNEEAKALIGLFGPDEYFGLSWTLLHLIETAPGWPIRECLLKSEQEWIRRLIARIKK